MSSRPGPPLFLPPDPNVEPPYRLSPWLSRRVAIVGGVAVVVFLVLLFRLWALQVISGDKYLEDARNNQIRTLRGEAPRGAILAANGDVLVENTPGTVVRFLPNSIPEETRDEVIERLALLFDVPRKELRRRVAAVGDDPLTPVVIRSAAREAKVNYLYEHRSDFPGVYVAKAQLRKYPQGTLAAHLLGYVGEVSEEELRRLDPSHYQGGDEIGKSGVEFAQDRYLRGIPQIDQVRVDALGRLKSTPTTLQEPQAGNSIRLTLDLDLQRATEQALARGIERSRDGVLLGPGEENGGWAAGGGAVVVMRADTGAILALASYPTFDPAIWVGRRDQAKIEKLGDPTINMPGLNRALTGYYPPGSVWKPVTALAAMNTLSDTGSTPILRADELVQCVPKRVVDGQVFRNWSASVNEAMVLREALAESCDTYFYEVGLEFYYLDGDRGSPFQEWARKFGFGELPGLDVGPQGDGLLPTPEWKKRYFKTPVGKLWKSGDSVQLAIGQGDLLVTPLQMTRFYALLANGGRLPTPHVVAQVEKSVGSTEQPVVLRRFPAPPPQDVGLAPATVEAIRLGLFDATHDPEGTSYKVFASYPVPIAGKTGTAEKWQQLPKGYLGILDKPSAQMLDQAWWCGYGPDRSRPGLLTDVPPIAVCVLVENGGRGGATAAPIARDVFSAYFGLDITSETILTGNASGESD